jgi:DNA repair protein RadC
VNAPWQKWELRVTRVRSETAEESPVLSQAVARELCSFMTDLPHEEMWILMADGTARLIGMVRISQGGIAGCAVTPCDIFRPAIAACARAIIVVHNHPSGDETLSETDRRTEAAIRSACHTVGVELLDFFVVGGAQ